MVGWGGSALRCGSLGARTWKTWGAEARPAAPPETPFPVPAGVSRGQSRLGLRMRRGRAGLGSGASPPGAAPSDRLPPLPPQGLRAPAPSA